jgi:hypothetical protein
MEPIVNKVAASGLITFKMEQFLPQKPIEMIDLSAWLWQGMVLREKEFRLQLKEHDWKKYQHKIVGVYCSTDAIVPTWAWMLVSGYLQEYNINALWGNKEVIVQQLIEKNIELFDASPLKDAKVVVKGCGEIPIPDSAYFHITQKLKPIVKSLFFGEPCSTVPLFKRKE